MTTAADRPPVAARPFIYLFLAVFLLSLLLAVEWWPLTAFKLFSQVRTGTVAGWEVTVVATDGDERPAPWDELPRGFRGWFQLAGQLSEMDAGERDTVLRAWGEAAREHGGIDVDLVRVYRTVSAVRTDADDPPPPAERTLRWELQL